MKPKTDGDRARIRAVMLCKEEKFYTFLLNTKAAPTKGAYQNKEEWCIECLYTKCDISSRSELTYNVEAQKKLKQLERSYQNWLFPAEEIYADNLSREDFPKTFSLHRFE